MSSGSLDTVARVARRVVLYFYVFVATAVPSVAQDVALAGRVVDASGAVIPGVTVTASSGPERRSVVTNREGRFTFATLAPGTYDIQAELFGFSPAIARGIAVPLSAESPQLELRLEAAGVSESVTITGTRAATPIAALPTSVTVLGRESLD